MTLSAIHPTLLDLAKRSDPNNDIATIVEILSEQNEVLQDMVWIEGNLPTGHRTTIRTGLPSVTWRKLYGGVQPSRSTTAQVTDNCGMLEAYAEVDKALADLNGNTAAFRLSESIAFLEAMNQEFCDTLWYGNEGTEPEAFTGFAPRFNSQSAENGGNILTSAATPDNADNASIWLVGWGANTVHGIIPKGSTAGLQRKDLGEVTAENIDGSNGRAQIYREHFRWDCGLSVRDWRYVVRVQYDEEDLVGSAASGPLLYDLMAEAIDLIPNLSACRPAFYANRKAKSILRRQMQSRSIYTLTTEKVGAFFVDMFAGIPVRRCDSLLSNETGI